MVYFKNIETMCAYVLGYQNPFILINQGQKFSQWPRTSTLLVNGKKTENEKIIENND